MKKLCVTAALVLMLSGCGAPESFETISDLYDEPPMQPAQQTSLLLAEEAVNIQREADGDRIFLCDDFCVMVQTFSSGDLDATIRSITGYPKDKLMVMERQSEDVTS